MLQWLVIIARDRPELWATWTAFFGGAERFEIILDRRQGQPGTATGHHPDRRVRPPRDYDVHERGFLVIPLFVFTGASR
jgi:hypothetical protein